jgi:DNA-directed RNA polymerase subunit N (RpoN/RPB10)
MPRPSKNIENLTDIDVHMRCFSCGMITGDVPMKWDAVEETLTDEEKQNPHKDGIIMDKMGLTCVGCRTTYSAILYRKT